MNKLSEELTYEEAERLALCAIHDTDGRGMVGRGRNHLHQRVARAILQAHRSARSEALSSPGGQGNTEAQGCGTTCAPPFANHAHQPSAEGAVSPGKPDPSCNCLTDWRHCAPCNSRRTAMSEFQQYRRKQIAELRPYVPGEMLSERVSISAADRDAGSPKAGDMIARNPVNHDDQWLVAAAYFADNFEPVK